MIDGGLDGGYPGEVGCCAVGFWEAGVVEPGIEVGHVGISGLGSYGWIGWRRLG